MIKKNVALTPIGGVLPGKISACWQQRWPGQAGKQSRAAPVPPLRAGSRQNHPRTIRTLTFKTTPGRYSALNEVGT